MLQFVVSALNYYERSYIEICKYLVFSLYLKAKLLLFLACLRDIFYCVEIYQMRFEKESSLSIFQSLTFNQCLAAIVPAQMVIIQHKYFNDFIRCWICIQLFHVNIIFTFSWSKFEEKRVLEEVLLILNLVIMKLSFTLNIFIA